MARSMMVNPPVDIDRAIDLIRRSLEKKLSRQYGEPVRVAVNNIDARPHDVHGWAWHVRYVIVHKGYERGRFYLNENAEMQRILPNPGKET